MVGTESRKTPGFPRFDLQFVKVAASPDQYFQSCSSIRLSLCSDMKVSILISFSTMYYSHSTRLYFQALFLLSIVIGSTFAVPFLSAVPPKRTSLDKPDVDLCPLCIQFSGEFLDQLLNIILSELDTIKYQLLR